MSVLLHLVVYVPVTMAAGAYVWVRRAELQTALRAVITKMQGKK